MTEVQWLTEEERIAWVRFSAVLELLPAALDAQLKADANLTYFEYFSLAMLSEAPDHVLRMSALAARTNATLPRLSRVVTQLEKRGLVARVQCSDDRRAINVTLTEAGWETMVETAPSHVRGVREYVVDALTPEQMRQLSAISTAMLARLDPDNRMLSAISAE